MSNLIEINSAVNPRPAPSPFRLTAREAEAMDLVYLPNRMVAECMGCSLATVKRHYRSAFIKIGADSRVQAALLWERATSGTGIGFTSAMPVAVNRQPGAVDTSRQVHGTAARAQSSEATGSDKRFHQFREAA